MPHQCVRCNTFYADDAGEIIKGCAKCQGKLFFYVKSQKLEQARQTVEAMSEDTKQELAEEVSDIIGHDVDEREPVVVNIETIRVIAPGKYELDLEQLLDKDHPVIYKLGEGKYVVDIASTLERLRRRESGK